MVLRGLILQVGFSKHRKVNLPELLRVQPDLHQYQLFSDCRQACFYDLSVSIQLQTVDLCVSG